MKYLWVSSAHLDLIMLPAIRLYSYHYFIYRNYKTSLQKYIFYIYLLFYYKIYYDVLNKLFPTHELIKLNTII